MAFTIEFRYENGEPVKALDNEVLDEDKVKTILRLRVNDTIQLGSGSEKRNYKVLKIERNFIAAKVSGQSEDSMHFDFTVEPISTQN